MKKVSVIMGCYNCATTLGAAIESIINQTYQNVELIMCDDCSDDDTFVKMKDYKEKYPERIKILRNDTNLSLGPTLNKCLSLVSGEYVARMDADDISSEERIQTQVDFLENHLDIDLVGTSMRGFDEKGFKSLFQVKEGYVSKYNTVFSVPFLHATIMAKANVYKQLNGYNLSKYTKRVEDVDLWFRFFEKGFTGYNLNLPLYYVRQDGSEYKRRTFSNYLNAFLVCLKGAYRLKLPLVYYIGAFNPLVKYFVPVFVKKYLHKKRYEK